MLLVSLPKPMDPVETVRRVLCHHPRGSRRQKGKSFHSPWTGRVKSYPARSAKHSAGQTSNPAEKGNSS